MTTKLFLATMQTEHYLFQSVAADAAAAKKAIARGWVRHLTEKNLWTDRTIKTALELEDWYGINVTELELNDCARDHEAWRSTDGIPL